jgi:histidine ammonia-lyase
MNTAMATLTIRPGDVTLSELRALETRWHALQLDPACHARVQRSVEVVRRFIAEGRTVYGVNTGFGRLASTRIESAELGPLQRRLVLSHAAGVGAPLAPGTVRLLIALKLNALGQGLSGVRLELLEALLALINRELYPWIPEQGSVGASGDLAPLAHLSAVLLGEGHVLHHGEKITARDALRIAELRPLELAPKEGLALLNGTQASTALALAGLFATENLLAAGTVIGALSVEAARGSRTPFDERIQQARRQAAQRDIAALYRALLADSEIASSHRYCRKVQDPYSLRCQPQVMGACLEQLRHAAGVLEVEANAVSDNPLVFPDSGEILSGGNFHAEIVAMAADNLALALAEIGALSERRTAMLVDSTLSGLPPFLVEDSGLNSGFMLAQVTAAALASENKSLAHPASVDSLPTSANQEDHVSMATFAARRLRDMAQNTQNILAIEWLAACQGLDLLAPLETSKSLERARAELRREVGPYTEDRFFAPDIEAASALIGGGFFLRLLGEHGRLLPG